MESHRPLIRHSREALFLRMLAVTAVMVTLVAGATAWFLLAETESLVQQEAARDARVKVERELLKSLTPADVAEPLAGAAYERVDARVRENLLGPEVVRIKVWNPQGTVVYSSLQAQVGESVPDNEGLQRALSGELSWEIEETPESRFEMEEGRQLEVYFPLRWAPGGAPAAGGEVYLRYGPYARLIGTLRGKVILAGLVVFMTLPLGLYILYRTAWAAILMERDLAAQRLREVEALNALLQRDVAYTLDLRDSLLDLQRDVAYKPATSEELALHYAFLSRHVDQLATRAGRFLEGREVTAGGDG